MRPLYEQGLRAWVDAVLGQLGYSPVIYSNQGKPRPIPPYADILILSDGRIGQDGHYQLYDGDNDRLIEGIKSRRRGTCTISAYGGDYDTAVHELAASATRQSIKDLLATYGVTLGDNLSIQRLSIDTDGVIEERAVLDFSYRWAYNSEEATTIWIASAEITK